MRLALVDNCACPASIAPYVKRVLDKADQEANSIYRGDDAKALLHKHGKRTQREIHRDMPAVSNPPGFSSHELFGDGTVGVRGKRLPEWRVGIDSGSDSAADAARIEAAARSFGWVVEHPYSRGVERHHWNFKRQPRPKNPAQFAHIVAERRALVKAAR